VALVRPASTPAGALAESVPPSANRLLTELGILEAVEGAGFHPNRGNMVWWAGRDPRRETFAEAESGFHCDREGLESVLGRAAESIGVRLYDGLTARTADESTEGWSVVCEASDGSAVELRAPWVLDATGRHGFLARREGREPDRSTTTIALVRRWEKPGGWEPDTIGHTLVESYVDGWAWSVPLTAGLRCFTAMVDQRHADLEGLPTRRMRKR